MIIYTQRNNEVSSIQSSLKKYWKIEDFDILVENFENFRQNTEDTYYKRLVIDKKLASIESFVADTYATKFQVENTYEQTNQKWNDVDEKIVQNNSQIQKLNALVEKNKGDVTQWYDIWKTKTNIEDTQDLREQIKTLSTKKSVNMLRDEIFPMIEKCSKAIGDFKTDVYMHSQMIRRFDEVMCEKAQKTSIQEVYNELLQYVKRQEFIDENNNVKQKVDDKLDEFNEMKEAINELNEKVSFEIQSAVRKAFKSETIKIMQMVQNMIPKSSGSQDADILK